MGVWLRSASDSWLQMALEGRLLHAYIGRTFGQNEALHHLFQERAALCAAETCEALVPTADEMRLWGGHLHPEQIWTQYRMRKAAWVLRMIERQVERV